MTPETNTGRPGAPRDNTLPRDEAELHELLRLAADSLAELRAAAADLRRERRAQALEADRLLTIYDVLELVPWGRTKVDEMIARRQIPMLMVENRWVITREAFNRAAADGFPIPAGRVSTRAHRSTRGRKPTARGTAPGA